MIAQARTADVALQQSLDEPNRWGQYSYEKGSYLEDLIDGAIEVITEHVPQKNSPLSATLIYRLDHAYSAVPDEATAFGGRRTDRYAMFMVAVCPTPEPYDAERAWVRSFWDTLRPHAIGIGS